MTELQWARILVKLDGRSLLSSAQVVVGSGCFSILLWWEFLTMVCAGGAVTWDPCEWYYSG